MELSLAIITENLSVLGSVVSLTAPPDIKFRGVRKLTDAPEALDASFIYVCRTKTLAQLSDSQLRENYFIVKASRPTELRGRVNGVGISCSASTNEIMNAMIAMFDRFESFQHTVREAALGKSGLQPFFDIAADVFSDCLVIASDPSFNLVGASAASVEDEYINSILERGYFDVDDLNRMAMAGYYEDERKYVKPIFYDAEHTVCGKPYLVRSFRADGAAHSFVGCYLLDGEPPTLMETELFTIFSSAIEEYYEINGVLSLESEAYQPVIKELIGGELPDSGSFSEICARLRVPFHGPFRLGIIQSDAGSRIKSSQILNQLKLHCPLPSCGRFLHESSVLVLFYDWSAEDALHDGAVGDGLKTLKTILEANKSYIGISSSFQDISEFYIGYRQALAAVEAGGKCRADERLYLYSDYCIYDMLASYGREMPLSTVCVQYLERIVGGDAGRAQADIELLYYYLSCERSLSQTAEKVHMHRNSVIYRIQKIEDRLGLDLDDANVRLRLILTIRMYMNGMLGLSSEPKK